MIIAQIEICRKAEQSCIQLSIRRMLVTKLIVRHAVALSQGRQGQALHYRKLKNGGKEINFELKPKKKIGKNLV